MSEPAADGGEGDAGTATEVRCYFVRKRNVLAVRGEFSGMYLDYYLHRADAGVEMSDVLDGMLKDALAAMTLHAASRPWKEVHAWTLNFQSPLANLFVTGDNTLAGVTGRVFTEDIRRGERSLFFSQVQTPGGLPRTSSVDFEGSDIFRAVEQFYRQSEQRPGRYFRYSEEDFVFLAAQPQADLDWLFSLDDDAIRRLDRDEELSLLEERSYSWKCGCTLERIYRVLSSKGIAPDALFGGDAEVFVTCPRCAMRYRIARDRFDEWVAANR